MSSSIFNSDYAKRFRALPAGEKRWLAVVALTMTLALALGIAALPKRMRVNHMTAGADALDDRTKVLVIGSSHVYRAVNPRLMSTRSMNLAADAFDYVCMEAALAAGLRRAPNVEMVIVEVDPVIYRMNSINYYWEDFRILFDLRCDINTLDTTVKRKISLWYQWFWYTSILAPVVGEAKLTPAYLYERFHEPPRPPVDAGFVASDVRINPSTDGVERVRRHIRDLGRVSEAQLSKNYRALERLVGDLLAGGYRVAVTRLPHHLTYRNTLPDDWVAMHGTYVAQLESRFAGMGLRIWDFDADPRFTDEDFWDGDHLNNSGAAKFTKILDQRVAQVRDDRSRTDP